MINSELSINSGKIYESIKIQKTMRDKICNCFKKALGFISRILSVIKRFVRGKEEILILIGILIIASFFRLWQLGTIPPGLYPDEAINANQAALEPGKIFYPENNGREGLYINLLSLSFNLFGVSIFSARLVSALIGILTVLGIYLLCKQLFAKARVIPLLAAFFLAVCFWHVNFSRILFRAILVPFFLIYGFYFLFKGFRNALSHRNSKGYKKWLNFVLAGIFMGFGFHTYIAFRLSVLILFPVLLAWFFLYRQENKTKKFLQFAACSLFVTFLVGLPIAFYFLQNPADFFGRSAGVSVFSQDQWLFRFAESFVTHLGMFNFMGDGNWRHNIAGQPILFWPVGVLFIIGLIYSFWEIKQSIKAKDWQLVLSQSFLLLWLGVMLLPGVLTYEGIPHSLRVIGAIPPVFILSALGGYLVFRQIRQRVRIEPEPLTLAFVGMCLFALIASFVLAQYSLYFELWGLNKETAGAFGRNLIQAGNYLNSLPLGVKKYVVVGGTDVLVNGIPMPAQTIMFIETLKYGRPNSTYILPSITDLLKIESQGPAVIVLLRYDEQTLFNLLDIFPKGGIERQGNLWIYKI